MRVSFERFTCVLNAEKKKKRVENRTGREPFARIANRTENARLQRVSAQHILYADEMEDCVCATPAAHSVRAGKYAGWKKIEKRKKSSKIKQNTGVKNNKNRLVSLRFGSGSTTSAAARSQSACSRLTYLGTYLHRPCTYPRMCIRNFLYNGLSGGGKKNVYFMMFSKSVTKRESNLPDNARCT